jgi:hypothetical protein
VIVVRRGCLWLALRPPALSRAPHDPRAPYEAQRWIAIVASTPAVPALLLLALAGCAQPGLTSAVAIPSISPSEARIWIYRDYQPSESPNLAAVTINGASAGDAQPAGGAFYRDVPPGHYHIAVASYGTDTGQSSDIDLPAGEEAYVQIQSLSAWATGGGDDVGDFKRDTFYARLIPAKLARVQIARSPFYGGS